MFKVMLVDDEPNIRRGLPYIINWEDYDFSITAVAKNGKDAIRKLESSYPDMIIADINMPVMDGLSLLRYIRERLNDSRMTFLILSGYDDFKYAKKAIQYNVQNYLLKPIDEEKLINILSDVKTRLTGGKYRYFYEKYVKEYNNCFVELEEFNSLVNKIENNKITDIKKTVAEIFTYFRNNLIHPNIIKMYLDNFLINVSKIVNLRGGEADNVLQQENILQIDFGQVSCRKLEKTVVDFALKSAAYVQELKENSGLINNVKQYIDKNYSKKIRLKDIAEKYHINAAYLGRLFKKETGFCYCDYLNKIRLQNAKRLLTRTDLHVYQIADRVGYKNSDYFIIKFKENENCTPLEYKKEHLRNQE